MDELISVIVPVYNVEKYLEKCVESLLKQTYDKLQIVLVDDGSTDGSSSICDKYKKIDSRIKVIHKNNGGLSDARNIGLKNSDGRYVCFIDSDDYISEQMIELLYKNMILTEADICCCGKVLEYEKNNIIVNNNLEFCVDNVVALKKMLLNDNIDNSACDKIYKIELFDNIKFPVGRYYEDIATVYKLFFKAKKVSHINYVGYHYFIRNNSISKESFSSKQLDSVYFSKQAKDDVCSIYPEISSSANAYYYLELMTTLRKMKRATNFKDYTNEYMEIKKEFNINISNIFKNENIVSYKKIMALFIYLNMYKLVEIIYKIMSKKK